MIPSGVRFPEPQEYRLSVPDHVVDGEPDDPGEGLGIEEHDDAGDAKAVRRIRIGQQPAEHVQTFVFAERGPPGELQCGQGERASAVAAL
ncbi:hypothetical protein ACIOJD_26370 [Streptomyces sp. NPDC088116]|uniref:hypothetical protein n=1 Tax=Streptomyces sp. NPDC088116 TaxID=3365825 RepID=UPI00381EDF51